MAHEHEGTAADNKNCVTSPLVNSLSSAHADR